VAAWTATRGAPSAAPAAPTRGAEGVVVVQTREPEHHAVQALVRWDPGGFWREESTRRAELRFPPAGYAIRLDVAGDGDRVAEDLRGALPEGDALLGPRRDGERSGLLVKSGERWATLEALEPLRRAWSEAGLDVRFDVDPVDVA
jgi:primosomal protein N' (replication factor Y) (superfamily II helicase)